MVKADRQTMLRLVVEACDDARDVYELAQQLAPLLPIKKFANIEKLKTVKFRDQEFEVAMFADLIPSVAFPIDDVETLVRRVAGLVDAVPDFVGVQPDSSEFLRRQVERLAMPGVQASGFPKGVRPSQARKAFEDAGRIVPLGDMANTSEG